MNYQEAFAQIHEPDNNIYYILKDGKMIPKSDIHALRDGTIGFMYTTEGQYPFRIFESGVTTDSGAIYEYEETHLEYAMKEFATLSGYSPRDFRMRARRYKSPFIEESVTRGCISYQLTASREYISNLLEKGNHPTLVVARALYSVKLICQTFELSCPSWWIKYRDKIEWQDGDGNMLFEVNLESF
jgi:hypothetical protein